MRRRSAGAAPFLVQGQAIGSLNISWRNPQEISDHTIRFAKAVANLAAIGLALQDRVADAESLALLLEDSAQTRITGSVGKRYARYARNVPTHEAFRLILEQHQGTGHAWNSTAAHVISCKLRASDLNPTSVGHPRFDRSLTGHAHLSSDT